MIAPVYEWIAYFYYLSASFIFYFLAYIFIETSLVRLAIDWYWKRAPPYNDDFLVTFFTWLNVTFSLATAGMTCFVKDSIKIFYRVQDIQDLPKIEFGRSRLGIGEVVVSLLDFAIGLAVISQVVKMIRQWQWRRNRVDLQSTNPIPSRSRTLNNLTRNRELVGARSQIAFFVLLLIAVTPFLDSILKDKNDQMTLERSTLMEQCSMISLYIIVPLMLYIRNPKLRRHFVHDFLFL